MKTDTDSTNRNPACPDPDHMGPAIHVEKLAKSYHGTTALHGLSLDVMRGEAFGLLGANGAGKSTAIECILGTRKPDSGTVSVLQMDPVMNRKELYQRVGVQFQESSYPDHIRVWELCEETMSLYRRPLPYGNLLDRFGLKEKSGSMIKDLSGGQKQRLFVVLALMMDPEVVFLDELTTGLDVKARRDVWKHLLELKQAGTTIFLTSHLMDEVEVLCDRIAILSHGRVIFKGTVKEAIEASPCSTMEDAYIWFTKEEENEDIQNHA